MKDINEKSEAGLAAGNPDLNAATSNARPVGTNRGATGESAAGAAIGATAGSVRAAVEGVAGAVADGLAGKGAAEQFNPGVDDVRPNVNALKRPSGEHGVSYISYHPAFRSSYERHTNFPGKSYEDVGSHLG